MLQYDTCGNYDSISVLKCGKGGGTVKSGGQGIFAKHK